MQHEVKRIASRVAVALMCAAGQLAARSALAQPATQASSAKSSLPLVSRAVGYYDEELERVVLIGRSGQPRPGERFKVWSWTGKTWELMTEAGPRVRGNAGGAYDAARRLGVVTGGAARTANDSAYEVIAETEITDARGWRKLSGTEVTARDHQSMTFDRQRNTLVLFGGIGGDRATPWPADTWELNANGWMRVATEGPSGRGRTAMVYDATRRQVVLFGGVGAEPARGEPQPFFGDTWVWENQHWRRVADHGPKARYAHGMAYDQRAGVVLMYGGAGAFRGTANFADMWKWDGARWTEIVLTGPTPGHRYQPVMVYDRKRGRTVLYGGLDGKDDATWEWDSTQWLRITP